MDYAERVKRLASARKSISEEQCANAAVALLLKFSNADVEVLFVKRVENPEDPWSGQMALPGGKRDPCDHSLKETVLRETAEEINVDLRGCCQFLGVLKPLKSVPRPELKILPFIILLKDNPPIKLNEGELEEFIWISLTDLVQNKGTVTFAFGEFPAYIVGDIIIWGLTYRILEMFFHTLNAMEEYGELDQL